MGAILHLRGAYEKLPTNKNNDNIYFATDTKQLWVCGQEYIKEPSAEGDETNVLKTDGSGKRFWGCADNHKFPQPINKQTAPLYTTAEELNLTPTELFSPSSDGITAYTARRIPAFIISNNDVYLSACEYRASLSDASHIGIVFATKNATDTTWSYTTLFDFNSTDSFKYMNPSFCIDRGYGENSGRIYLFCMKIQITSSNGGLWTQLSGSDVSNVYKYSDDEGQTWSEEQTMDVSWGSRWKYSTISASNSVMMQDGTIVCPCMGFNSSGVQRSGIVYKKSGETTWHYSAPTPFDGENECAAYENNGKLYVNTRNTGLTRNVYEYDFDNDKWNFIDDSFVPNNASCAAIEEMTLYGVHMYAMAFIDTDNSSRQNPTLWISADGVIFARAIKMYNGVVGSSAGYCMCSSHNNYIAFVYEYDGKIYFTDLTDTQQWSYGKGDIANILMNCAAFLSLSEQYEIEIKKTDRYSALSYLFGNVVTTNGSENSYVNLLKYANYAANDRVMDITTGNERTQYGWKFLYIDVSKYQGRTVVVSLSDCSKALGYAFASNSYVSSGNTFIQKEGGTGTTFNVYEKTLTVPDGAQTLYVDYLYSGSHQITPYVKLLRN